MDAAENGQAFEGKVHGTSIMMKCNNNAITIQTYNQEQTPLYELIIEQNTIEGNLLYPMFIKNAADLFELIKGKLIDNELMLKEGGIMCFNVVVCCGKKSVTHSITFQMKEKVLTQIDMGKRKMRKLQEQIKIMANREKQQQIHISSLQNENKILKEALSTANAKISKLEQRIKRHQMSESENRSIIVGLSKENLDLIQVKTELEALQEENTQLKKDLELSKSLNKLVQQSLPQLFKNTGEICAIKEILNALKRQSPRKGRNILEEINTRTHNGKRIQRERERSQTGQVVQKRETNRVEIERAEICKRFVIDKEKIELCKIKINEEGNRIKCIKQINFGSFSLIGSPLEHSQSYRFKIINLPMHGIIFGVATPQIVRVKNAHQHKQFIGLNAGGYLWRRGRLKLKKSKVLVKEMQLKFKNKLDQEYIDSILVLNPSINSEFSITFYNNNVERHVNIAFGVI